MPREASIPRLVRRLAPAALVVAAAALATHARAKAPACRYTINGPAALDVETGLTWQRQVPNQQLTHDEAAAYCLGLSLGGVGGWRMPTAQELGTIIDTSATTPAMDTATFTDGSLDKFWTSTIPKNDVTQAFLIQFFAAQLYTDVLTATHQVRCVH